MPDASSHTSCGLNGPRWSDICSVYGMHVSVYGCGCKPVHTGLPLTDPITIKEQVLLVSKTCVVSSKLPNDSV